MLLDSNIIIYSYQPGNEYLRDFIISNNCFLSKLSIIETLGYHLITTNEKRYINYLFKYIKFLPINDEVIQKAVKIRQHWKITTGDSIIASTALVNSLQLITRNTKVFEKIKGLKIMNPLI